jgi:nuclear pore complex protein Nup62
MCVFVCVCVCVWVWVCISVCMFVCVSVSVCVYVWVYMCVWVWVCVSVCVWVYVLCVCVRESKYVCYLRLNPRPHAYWTLTQLLSQYFLPIFFKYLLHPYCWTVSNWKWWLQSKRKKEKQSVACMPAKTTNKPKLKASKEGQKQSCRLVDLGPILNVPHISVIPEGLPAYPSSMFPRPWCLLGGASYSMSFLSSTSILSHLSPRCSLRPAQVTTSTQVLCPHL